MSVCNTCTRVKSLYTCVTTIVIGTIEELNEPVLVYFKNVATGKISVIDATSSAEGLIAITDFPEFIANVDYEVWITLNPSDNAEDRLIIMVEDTEHTCFFVQFRRLYYPDNTTVTALTQTFELA